MMRRLQIYGFSDIGKGRAKNEDVWIALKDLPFFALADGVGGHLAGEVAAKIATHQIASALRRTYCHHKRTLPQAAEYLRLAIDRANSLVWYLGKRYPTLRGMGTTLCCALLHPKGMIHAHVGNSRIYRFAKSSLHPLTIDHSLLTHWVETGHLSPEEAAGLYFLKHVITKALGMRSTVLPAISWVPVQEEDVFLLCSDGLSDYVPDHLIAKQLQASQPFAQTAEQLIYLAKQNGSRDNITLLLIKIL